ncbi:MAG: FAD:protein FMN transferase [Clostridiales bacterium]|nr:FAD:protein FMN transferase [Clostridiales bacterium]
MRRWRWALLAVAMLVLTGCSERKAALTAYNAQFFDYFDTFTTVTVYAESEDQFAKYENLIREEMDYYHRLTDIYYDYEGMNNAKTVNDHAGLSPVQVDRELIDLLLYAKEEYEVTDGKMNVAMGSVLSIWHEYRERGTADPERAVLPEPTELEQAAEHMDIADVVIDEEASTVYLADEGMSLDLGAVAKGYAAECVAAKLKEAGVTSALLSLGGNVRTIGTKPDGSSWRVGIQNPDAASEMSYIHAVDVNDSSLVTSGTYQRYYEVDGVRYHHIIHPDTRMPWNEYVSVTILCADSGRADALSTAVFNMEPDEGLAFVESQEGVEALWVFADGSEMESSGMGTYVEE